MAAGEQMAVDVEGRLNLRVAHEGLDGLGVGSCVDQERGKRMAALVQRDRGEQLGVAAISRLLPRSRVEGIPCGLGSVINRRGNERIVRVSGRRQAPHHFARCAEWSPPSSPSGLRASAPRAVQIGTWVQSHPPPDTSRSTWIRFVLKSKSQQRNACSSPRRKARVERGCPNGPVLWIERAQERSRFLCRGNARRVLRPAGRQVDPFGGVYRQIVAVNGSTVERLNRIEDVADGPDHEARTEQLVRQELEVLPPYVGDLELADRRGRNVNPQRSLVGADRVWLVRLASLGSDRPCLHPVNELRQRARQCPPIACRLPKVAVTRRAQRVGTPRLRF